MIKLFRNIRQNLLNDGKTGKYLKYAIGEIILVVIGILIALQVSNWNQNRIKYAQEKDDLYNLKEELKDNIVDFISLDSLYSKFEQSSADGLKIFNNNPKVEDLRKIDTLITTRLTVFPLTRSSYDEMLNTGKFYNLKNKLLKTKITQFYSKADNYTQAFLEINKETLNMLHHPDLYSYSHLLDRLKMESKFTKNIDTSWINDQNSKTYLALYKKVNYIQEYSNQTRRELLANQIVACTDLVALIDQELGSRK